VPLEQEASIEKKNAKRWAIACTIIYTIIAPSLFYMALLLIMIEDFHRTTVLGITVLFAGLCVVLSIPVSIYLMWSRYFHRDYRKTRFFCALPLITFSVVNFILGLLGAL
jgi:hypothetical protein